MGVKVNGVSAVVGRLYTKRGETAQNMQKALLKAGLFLQRKSQQVVPVDTGNLKGSAFTKIRPGTSGFSTHVDVGYTASYAIYVHENLTARHKPGKIAKYLEKPAKDYREEMIQIIRATAQAGGKKR